LRIEIGQSVTVEVEPWTGWTGSAVSGTPGSRVRAAATYDPERRDPRATIRIVSTTRTSETLEYQGRLGPLGRGPLEYRRRIDRPRIDGTGAEGPWGPGPGDGWAALPIPPPQEVVTRAKLWPRTVVLQVRDADLQVAEARHTIAPELPALDPTDGTIDRSVPFNDGKFAVIAEDPAGERIAENVQDASGRPVRSFFAKPSAEAPDTADAIPDGETKRVTTIDEAEGGGRAVKGLLQDGTVAPGKIRRDFPLHDGKFAVVAEDPSGLVIEPSVRQSDGVAPRALLKGHLSGVARDGQPVIFEHNFQHVPVVLFRGGINYEPRPDKWKPQGLFDEGRPQYDDVAALNLDTSGFILRARLRQKGTPTERAAYFPTDNVLFQAGQMVDAVLSDAPAVDDRYEVAYQVSSAHL